MWSVKRFLASQLLLMIGECIWGRRHLLTTKMKDIMSLRGKNLCQFVNQIYGSYSYSVMSQTLPWALPTTQRMTTDLERTEVIFLFDEDQVPVQDNCI
uniref:Secreted protein n=1 Tax=Lepeophtheirus salmonis TaxID=72036 RepID=A0A0K2UXW8_LEPSM